MRYFCNTISFLFVLGTWADRPEVKNDVEDVIATELGGTGVVAGGAISDGTTPKNEAIGELRLVTKGLSLDNTTPTSANEPSSIQNSTKSGQTTKRNFESYLNGRNYSTAPTPDMSVQHPISLSQLTRSTMEIRFIFPQIIMHKLEDTASNPKQTAEKAITSEMEFHFDMEMNKWYKVFPKQPTSEMEFTFDMEMNKWYKVFDSEITSTWYIKPQLHLKDWKVSSDVPFNNHVVAGKDLHETMTKVSRWGWDSSTAQFTSIEAKIWLDYDNQIVGCSVWEPRAS